MHKSPRNIIQTYEKHTHAHKLILNSKLLISRICEYLTKHKLKSKHTCSITQQINEQMHMDMQNLIKLKNMMILI